LRARGRTKKTKTGFGRKLPAGAAVLFATKAKLAILSLALKARRMRLTLSASDPLMLYP
jgi:hypothetical protein